MPVSMSVMAALAPAIVLPMGRSSNRKSCPSSLGPSYSRSANQEQTAILRVNYLSWLRSPPQLNRLGPRRLLSLRRRYAQQRKQSTAGAGEESSSDYCPNWTAIAASLLGRIGLKPAPQLFCSAAATGDANSFQVPLGGGSGIRPNWAMDKRVACSLTRIATICLGSDETKGVTCPRQTLTGLVWRDDPDGTARADETNFTLSPKWDVAQLTGRSLLGETMVFKRPAKADLQRRSEMRAISHKFYAILCALVMVLCFTTALAASDAVIQGTVSDDAGRPIRGALVKASTSGKSVSRFTRADGRFEI